VVLYKGYSLKPINNMDERVCEFCNNSGFVTDLEYNTDVHTFVPVGQIECRHPLEDPTAEEVQDAVAHDHANDGKI
jgi:hypothetical protein